MADIKKVATRESYGKALAELGKEYDIKLKEVDRCGLSFIGTFKPFIANPLQFVKDQFTEGQVLSKLHLVRHFK